MDWEVLGAGSASAFVTSILTLLGWERRLKKLEDRKVEESFCDERHKEVDHIRESLDYLKSRIDKLIDLQMDGVKK